MAFEKAQQLLRLATMAAARRGGVSLDEIEQEFGCVRRTAQRMVGALRAVFPDVEQISDEERRSRWRLKPSALRELMTLTPDELAALDLAVRLAEGAGEDVGAAQLRSLRDKILALVPREKAASLDTDHEALLEAQGLAARPGPRGRTAPDVAVAISRALKGANWLEIVYRSPRAPARVVMPYGILLGPRRYLVAKVDEDPEGFRHFRTDLIQAARVLEAMFARDPAFSLDRYAQRAFGAFQREEEYGEVIWRFRADAAEHARAFQFHPDQVLEDQPDGALIVRFRAAGHLEMCWHLYTWGDAVEVLAPAALRAMVHPYRRSDFEALP